MVWQKLSPVPGFPDYTGPYKVGTIDVEVPLVDLDCPSNTPNADLETVQFRVFYPCEPSGHEKPVRWLPEQHQRGYLAGYIKSFGAKSGLADFFSLMPQLMYYINIPAHRNAKVLSPPTKSGRWPVMMFSHGLLGTRNAYSHLLGSVASHGCVVFAPEHRDGSAPVTYIHGLETESHTPLDYTSVSHNPSKETFDKRDEQLKQRLWEVACIHDAMLKMDAGRVPRNLNKDTSHGEIDDIRTVMKQFHNQLNVQEPGAISWAGHSFGACTMVQFIKSVYWNEHDTMSQRKDYKPLWTAATGSSLSRQITEHSPVMLLDLWCLPLHSPSTRWLWQKSMPSYAPSGSGGKVLLAVLSQAFFKWRSNLEDTKRVLSAPLESDRNHPGPRIFYPLQSAHLSQSDFGVLFPRFTKVVAKAEEPERTLKLNARAMLQVMREKGIEVAPTSKIDIEEVEQDAEVKEHSADSAEDWKILSTEKDSIRGWVAVDPQMDRLDRVRSWENEAEVSLAPEMSQGEEVPSAA